MARLQERFADPRQIGFEQVREIVERLRIPGQQCMDRVHALPLSCPVTLARAKTSPTARRTPSRSTERCGITNRSEPLKSGMSASSRQSWIVRLTVVIGELGRARTNDLAHPFPRQPQLAANLSDRLAINKMRMPDLRDRLQANIPGPLALVLGEASGLNYQRITFGRRSPTMGATLHADPQALAFSDRTVSSSSSAFFSPPRLKMSDAPSSSVFFH